MNIDERVRNFLASWPIIEVNLNKLLEEEEGHGDEFLDGQASRGGL